MFLFLKASRIFSEGAWAQVLSENVSQALEDR